MGIDADDGIVEVTEQWLEDSMDSLMGFYTSKIGGVLTTEATREAAGVTKGVDRNKVHSKNNISHIYNRQYQK